MRIGEIRLGPKRERASSSSPEKKSSSKVSTRVRTVVGIVGAREVKARDEGFERRVTVDEIGEEVGPIFDNRA
ncbi:hypothetical protein PS1_010208 [Malus domestica]